MYRLKNCINCIPCEKLILQCTHRIITDEFELALLHGFLDALAVASVPCLVLTPVPIVHQAAHLVVTPTTVVF